MPSWTMHDLDHPPTAADWREFRFELRRAYVESMQYLETMRQIRREIDASTTDPGKRLTKRLHTMDYRMAIEDYQDATNRIYAFGGMIGAELAMKERAEKVFERRATQPSPDAG
jgi:hypothetical protein